MSRWKGQLSRVARLWVAACALAACAGGAAGTNERYPEKKRPEPLRSASDGEVMGAYQQDPSDTLEGSLTNEHLGAESPHRGEEAEARGARIEYEECLEENKAAAAAAATGGAAPKPRVCEPPQ